MLLFFFLNIKLLFFFVFSSLSRSSKKVEAEGGASAAKKDSKRKRESSVSDDVEVKSPPPSPPEDDDDDGVQVRAESFFFGETFSRHQKKPDKVMAHVASQRRSTKKAINLCRSLCVTACREPGGVYCLCCKPVC